MNGLAQQSVSLAEVVSSTEGEDSVEILTEIAFGLFKVKCWSELVKAFDMEIDTLLNHGNWKPQDESCLPNRLESILNRMDLEKLKPIGRTRRLCILRIWYSHAADYTIQNTADREMARSYAKKALEAQEELGLHSGCGLDPLAKLRVCLVNDDLKSAEGVLKLIQTEHALNRGRKMLERYKRGEFFKGLYEPSRI